MTLIDLTGAYREDFPAFISSYIKERENFLRQVRIDDAMIEEEPVPLPLQEKIMSEAVKRKLKLI